MTRVPLEQITLPPNVTAGLNPLKVMAMAHELRSTNNDLDPILIRPEQWGWSITDGRHRFVAHVIAGRRDILAEEESVTTRNRRSLLHRDHSV